MLLPAPAVSVSGDDHVTPESLRAELAGLEARLTRRFAGAMLAQTLAVLGGVLAMLRLPE